MHLLRQLKGLLGTIGIIFLTTFCFSLHAQADDIIVKHGRVNPTVPGMPVTAGYFQLTNTTARNISLLRVSSDISDRVELHAHTMSNGVMRMQAVDSITIPANGSVALEPGGYHVMIMNLQNAVSEGEHVNLTLTFSNDHQQHISVEAKKPSPAGSPSALSAATPHEKHTQHHSHHGDDGEEYEHRHHQ